MTEKILSKVNSIDDLVALPEECLDLLCEEIREYIIDCVSTNGGHLASSLGAVELIVALDRVYNSEDDKIIFDVGHQAYAHKILTGRRELFVSLRKENGISGFPKRDESESDAFNTGHASTSVSAALGILRAKHILCSPGNVACLIGDGALTGGLAYEGLDDAGDSRLPLVILLNDNEMSINRNVGAMSRSLSRLRSSRGYNRFKIKTANFLDRIDSDKVLSRKVSNFKNRIKRFILPDTFFEDMGFTYLGPVDGHDVHELIRIISKAKSLKRPVVIHAITKKGKGFQFAEEHPELFHGVDSFDKNTGIITKKSGETCSSVFAKTLCALAEEDKSITAITAAMPEGTGLNLFSKAFPNRFFDVGIAEEHAVTMAAGMAAGGLRPVVALYSSFAQRAADELFHDVCLQNLPVVLCIDRAGFVGRDGETHNGLLDVSMFYDMPNLEILAPDTYASLRECLSYAVKRNGPTVVRYPRSPLWEGNSGNNPFIWREVLPIQKKNVIAYGSMEAICEEAVLRQKMPLGMISAVSLKPMDNDLLEKLNSSSSSLMVVEEGPPVLAREISVRYPDIKVSSVHACSTAVAQGSVDEQRARNGLDIESLIETFGHWLEEE